MRKLQAVAAGWLIVATSATAQAGLVSHNGSFFSFPAGSGEVDVEIFVLVDIPGFLLLDRDFFENATHVLAYAYDSPEPPVVLAEIGITKFYRHRVGRFSH